MSEKLRKLALNIKNEIKNEIKDDKLVITLSGSVGHPYWYDDEEEDFINVKQVKKLINNSDRDIVIKLNSPGGSVFDGIEVYNYLKDLNNHITIEVTALAASAASIIAMAGDKLVMCVGSQLMVHEASTFTWGNKADHEKTINALETVDSSLVSVYENKTGLDRKVITGWLNDEKWFTAEEAVENGLADSIKQVEEPKDYSNQIDITAMINDAVAKAIENHIINGTDEEVPIGKVKEIPTNKTAFQKFIKKGANK